MRGRRRHPPRELRIDDRERAQIGIEDQIEGRSVTTVDPRIGIAVCHAHAPAARSSPSRRSISPLPVSERPHSTPCSDATRAVSGAFVPKPRPSIDPSKVDASVEIRAEPAKIERAGLHGESPGLVAGPPQAACAADAPVQRVRVDGIYREGISADQSRRMPGGRWYLRTRGLGLHLVGVRETPADAVGAGGACDDRLARERPAQCRPLAAEREHR